MRLKTIELLTSSLQKAEAFYAGVLQLPVLTKTNGTISFQIGYSMLTFKATSMVTGAYHFAILMPKNNVEEGYRWLKRRTPVLPFNAEGDIADFANWNAQAFYFHDPFQNIIEFIAHHDLPYTCHDPFGAQALIGIAEIGLVVDDVDAACKILHHTYDVPYFSKGPLLKDFAVMGEEDGLLIVSAMGRGWLPTGQAAEPSILKINLELGAAVQEIEMHGPAFA